MKANIFVNITLITFVLTSTLHAQENLKLSFKYKKWLEEDINYIITDLEKKVFAKLKTDRDRDLFIKSFWKYRDPTPDTPENEFRVEHFRRIDYANKKFSRESYWLGWETDRGKSYIILGPPKAVTRFNYDHYNYEIWWYDEVPYKKKYPGISLFFIQYSATGEYVLVQVF
jgi:GWxTD domain-containing protein